MTNALPSTFPFEWHAGDLVFLEGPPPYTTYWILLSKLDQQGTWQTCCANWVAGEEKAGAFEVIRTEFGITPWLISHGTGRRGGVCPHSID